jgi:uncharacterized protein YukE
MVTSGLLAAAPSVTLPDAGSARPPATNSGPDVQSPYSPYHQGAEPTPAGSSGADGSGISDEINSQVASIEQAAAQLGHAVMNKPSPEGMSNIATFAADPATTVDVGWLGEYNLHVIQVVLEPLSQLQVDVHQIRDCADQCRRSASTLWQLAEQHSQDTSRLSGHWQGQASSGYRAVSGRTVDQLAALGRVVDGIGYVTYCAGGLVAGLRSLLVEDVTRLCWTLLELEADNNPGAWDLAHSAGAPITYSEYFSTPVANRFAELVRKLVTALNQIGPMLDQLDSMLDQVCTQLYATEAASQAGSTPNSGAAGQRTGSLTPMHRIATGGSTAPPGNPAQQDTNTSGASGGVGSDGPGGAGSSDGNGSTGPTTPSSVTTPGVPGAGGGGLGSRVNGDTGGGVGGADAGRADAGRAASGATGGGSGSVSGGGGSGGPTMPSSVPMPDLSGAPSGTSGSVGAGGDGITGPSSDLPSPNSFASGGALPRGSDSGSSGDLGFTGPHLGGLGGLGGTTSTGGRTNKPLNPGHGPVIPNSSGNDLPSMSGNLLDNTDGGTTEATSSALHQAEQNADKALENLPGLAHSPELHQAEQAINKAFENTPGFNAASTGPGIIGPATGGTALSSSGGSATNVAHTGTSASLPGGAQTGAVRSDAQGGGTGATTAANGQQAASGSPMNTGGAGSGGMGSMGGMGKSGKGGGDTERKRPGYIKGEQLFTVPGDDLPPAVIGELPAEPNPGDGT